jgi:cytochrome c oxidase cbb3-type subunit 4
VCTARQRHQHPEHDAALPAQAVASIAQQLGVVFFMTIFAVVVAYALWPKNREKFDTAAQMPLKED